MYRIRAKTPFAIFKFFPKEWNARCSQPHVQTLLFQMRRDPWCDSPGTTQHTFAPDVQRHHVQHQVLEALDVRARARTDAFRMTMWTSTCPDRCRRSISSSVFCSFFVLWIEQAFRRSSYTHWTTLIFKIKSKHMHIHVSDRTGFGRWGSANQI